MFTLARVYLVHARTSWVRALESHAQIYIRQSLVCPISVDMFIGLFQLIQFSDFCSGSVRFIFSQFFFLQIINIWQMFISGNFVNQIMFHCLILIFRYSL